MYVRASCVRNDGPGGIAARGQIYMGAPIGIVKIHLHLEIAAPVKVPPGRAARRPLLRHCVLVYVCAYVRTYVYIYNTFSTQTRQCVFRTYCHFRLRTDILFLNVISVQRLTGGADTHRTRL